MTRNNAAAEASPARVITRDGVGVEIDASFAHPEMTRIRLGNGVYVVLPVNMLQRQADGTLQIPLTSQELSAAGGHEVVIPVVEEQLRVGKRERETGEVVVHVTPHVRQETIDVPLAEEHVDVERVPVHQFVQGPVAVRQEGDVTVVPVLEEVLVVEKRLMLREEIRLTRRRETRRHVEHVSLRTEEARVLRAGGEKNTAS